MELTQTRLKELFTYNPNDGLFVRNTSRGCARKGAVSGYKNQYGYIQIIIDRTIYRAHRLVWLYMYGKFPDRPLDHVNHTRHDNRTCNLREVSNKENCKNMSLSKRNKSGVCGVIWDKNREKWSSSIRVNYKLITLGRFSDINQAIKAREEAEILYNFHANHGKTLITKDSNYG